MRRPRGPTRPRARLNSRSSLRARPRRPGRVRGAGTRAHAATHAGGAMPGGRIIHDRVLLCMQPFLGRNQDVQLQAWQPTENMCACNKGRFEIVNQHTRIVNQHTHLNPVEDRDARNGRTRSENNASRGPRQNAKAKPKVKSKQNTSTPPLLPREPCCLHQRQLQKMHPRVTPERPGAVQRARAAGWQRVSTLCLKMNPVQCSAATVCTGSLVPKAARQSNPQQSSFSRWRMMRNGSAKAP